MAGGDSRIEFASEDLADWAFGDDSGRSDSGSSMPPRILEQEGHKLGLHESEFAPLIVSPQQMQTVGLIIRKLNLGQKGFKWNSP